MSSEELTDEIRGYENLLAMQFQILETLVEISRKEREIILKGTPDALMGITDEKEVILDKFSLLEDKSRSFLQTIAQKMQIHSEKTSIQDILPYLDSDDSARINRLLDGINILVGNAKEINLGNQALVMTRLDLLSATQSFIASILQRNDCYNPPAMNGMNRNLAISGIEYQA